MRERYLTYEQAVRIYKALDALASLLDTCQAGEAPTADQLNSALTAMCIGAAALGPVDHRDGQGLKPNRNRNCPLYRANPPAPTRVPAGAPAGTRPGTPTGTHSAA